MQSTGANCIRGLRLSSARHRSVRGAQLGFCAAQVQVARVHCPVRTSGSASRQRLSSSEELLAQVGDEPAAEQRDHFRSVSRVVHTAAATPAAVAPKHLRCACPARDRKKNSGLQLATRVSPAAWREEVSTCTRDITAVTSLRY
jgi:hypothetical protein